MGCEESAGERGCAVFGLYLSVCSAQRMNLKAGPHSAESKVVKLGVSAQKTPPVPLPVLVHFFISRMSQLYLVQTRNPSSSLVGLKCPLPLATRFASSLLITSIFFAGIVI